MGPSSWKTKIPTKEEVPQIQKLIMDDISVDSDASLDKNDKRLLAESWGWEKKKKILRSVKCKPHLKEYIWSSITRCLTATKIV